MRKLCGANNQFETSPKLEEEFATMKRHLKKTIVLSPLEVGKEIHQIQMHQAMALVLYLYCNSLIQRKKKENKDHYRRKRNIITLGSGGLMSTQEHYS